MELPCKILDNLRPASDLDLAHAGPHCLSAASPLHISVQRIALLGTEASWLHLVPSIVATGQAEQWSE